MTKRMLWRIGVGIFEGLVVSAVFVIITVIGLLLN